MTQSPQCPVTNRRATYNVLSLQISVLTSAFSWTPFGLPSEVAFLESFAFIGLQTKTFHYTAVDLLQTLCTF